MECKVLRSLIDYIIINNKLVNAVADAIVFRQRNTDSDQLNPRLISSRSGKDRGRWSVC